MEVDLDDPKDDEVLQDRRFGGRVFDDLHGLVSRDVIGMMQIMFEDDYPHSDSTYTRSLQTAAEPLTKRRPL